MNIGIISGTRNQNLDITMCTWVISKKSIIWIWIFQNIIGHYLLNLGHASCLLRLKLDDTGVFHYWARMYNVSVATCGRWIPYSLCLRKINWIPDYAVQQSLTIFNEFHNIPELDKCVHLINNVQRDAIAFLVKVLTKRRNYMYVWTHPPSLFLCFILCYKPWHISPEWAGWPPSMDLLYVDKLTMSHVTKIKILWSVICYLLSITPIRCMASFNLFGWFVIKCHMPWSESV